MSESDAVPVINFYSTAGEYGCFSNFSRHSIFLAGKRWPTSEHYFQAMKFAGTGHEEDVRKCKTPSMAANMGQSRKLPLRRDWEAVKERAMLDALRAKFTQHADLTAILLGTGDAELVEHTENDSYWGDGGDGSAETGWGTCSCASATNSAPALRSGDSERAFRGTHAAVLAEPLKTRIAQTDSRQADRPRTNVRNAVGGRLLVPNTFFGQKPLAIVLTPH